MKATSITQIMVSVFMLPLFNVIYCQNNYTWTSKNATFTTKAKLKIESNTDVAFFASGETMSVSLGLVQGIEGQPPTSDLLQSYIHQFNYTNLHGLAEIDPQYSVSGAYIWAELKDDKLLLCLFKKPNSKFLLLCEIGYREGFEKTALNTILSLRFDTQPDNKNSELNSKPQTHEAKNVFTQISSEQLADNNLFLTLINKLRSTGCQCGDEYMPPVGDVVINQVLIKVATAHSKDMADRLFFSHESPDPAPYGTNPMQRLEYFNYKSSRVGENIAYGYTQTPESYFFQWVESPAHCRNLMDGSFNEIGYGVYGIYATLVFTYTPALKQ